LALWVIAGVYGVIDRLILNSSVNGWEAILFIMLFFSGLQLIMSGIMGEYIRHNLDESRKRPLYFIEKKK
jgi:hypothetical protein